MKTRLLLIVLIGLVWGLFTGISCADNWSITTTLDNGKSLYAEVSTGDINVLEGDVCECNVQIRWIMADAGVIQTLIQDSTKYQVYQSCIRITIRHADYADNAAWQSSVQTIIQNQMGGVTNGFIQRMNSFIPKSSQTSQILKSSR